MVTITERRKLAGKTETKKRKNRKVPVKGNASTFRGDYLDLGRECFIVANSKN
jgi:hypothetical protein